jgi:hypothetical protein
MKKIIGILGVVMIVATMFFSANNVIESDSDASLAGIIAINSANAESMSSTECMEDCDKKCVDQTSGATKTDCSSGQGKC